MMINIMCVSPSIEGKLEEKNERWKSVGDHFADYEQILELSRGSWAYSFPKIKEC